MGSGKRGDRISFAATREGAAELYEKDREKKLVYYVHSPRTKVFISFHMDDEQQVNLLRYQAHNSDKLEFKDMSLKEPFDEKWKTQCTEVIANSDVVVVAIGADTHARPAVLWEIEKAHELRIPIIGMRIHSDMNHKIPDPMIRNNDIVVAWNLDVLQAEIDKQKATNEVGEEK